MKRRLTLLAVALMAIDALALTIPDGFVYRARCSIPASGGQLPNRIDVTLRLYEAEASVMPSWTGFFKDVTLVTNGLFQIWVSEAAHSGSAIGESRLEDVIVNGKGGWLGVSFAAGRECKPRRMLVTAPLANEAAVATTLDANSVVGTLRDCETLTASDALVTAVRCDTLSLGDVMSGEFNLQNLNVRSVALLRDEDNQVLDRQRGEWSSPTELLPGAAITNTLGRTAFLTIRSTAGSRTAPALTVPVPAGGAFVWQAERSTNVWQFTALGGE